MRSPSFRDKTKFSFSLMLKEKCNVQTKIRAAHHLLKCIMECGYSTAPTALKGDVSAEALLLRVEEGEGRGGVPDDAKWFPGFTVTCMRAEGGNSPGLGPVVCVGHQGQDHS